MSTTSSESSLQNAKQGNAEHLPKQQVLVESQQSIESRRSDDDESIVAGDLEEGNACHRSIMFCGWSVHDGVEDVRDAIALVMGDEKHERLKL